MILNNKVKIFLALASFMMALAISLGAFGAHGLKSILDEYMLKIYHTGLNIIFIIHWDFLLLHLYML